MNDLLLRDLATAVREMTAEARKLRTALEEQRPAPARPDARHVALLAAIHIVSKSHIFTTSELIDHAHFEPTLAAAIIAAVGALSPRRCGKLFRRLEGQDVGGLCIERSSIDSRDGVVWTCRKFESMETRQTSFK